MVASVGRAEHELVQVVITCRYGGGHLNVDVEVTNFHTGRRDVLALAAIGIVTVVYLGRVHIQVDDLVRLS